MSCLPDLPNTLALVVAVLAGSAGEQILADPKIESVWPTVEGAAVVLGVAPKTELPLDRDDPPPKIEVVVVLAGLSVVAAAGAPKMEPPPDSGFAAAGVPPKIDVVDAAVVTVAAVVAAAARAVEAVVAGVPKMDPAVGLVPEVADAAPNKLLLAAAPAAVVLLAVVVTVADAAEAGFPKIDPLVEVGVEDPPVVVAMTAAAACPKIEAAFALLPATSADEVALVLVGLAAEDDPKMEPPLDVTFPATSGGLGDPNMVEVVAAAAPNNDAPLPGVVDAPPPPPNIDPAAAEGVEAAPKRLDPAAVVEVTVEAPKRDLEGAVEGLVLFYSVDFSQSRIGVNKCALNKCTIKVSITCCYQCPGTFAPSAAHLTAS